ncbi:MAG: FGGY-family carbohydrate kinase [Pseudomonadota bacterium]
MGTETIYLGVDIGTSGVRAIIVDDTDVCVAEAGARFSRDPGDPAVWQATLAEVLVDLSQRADFKAVRAVAVDGTSGTLLAVDARGQVLAKPIMYNEAVSDPETLAALEELGQGDASRSAAGRAFHFNLAFPQARILHQADWVASLFSGRFDVSDHNNALKTGFDPEGCRWTGLAASEALGLRLPSEVVAPGTAVGLAGAPLAQDLGFSPSTLVVAGTTDGCASFLASGATQEGDGVTALGSTLTLKLLSASRIEDPASGVYSHRLLDCWLTGGASNTGGRVLAQHFESSEIARLSEGQAARPATGLDYYPLPEPGERFPVNDASLAPVLTPRPQEDAVFLKAILEGIAKIEAAGYARLAALGGPSLARVFTVGGGAGNALWADIRREKLGLEPLAPLSTEAAFGAARLARMGAQ